MKSSRHLNADDLPNLYQKIIKILNIQEFKEIYDPIHHKFYDSVFINSKLIDNFQALIKISRHMVAVDAQVVSSLQQALADLKKLAQADNRLDILDLEKYIQTLVIKPLEALHETLNSHLNDAGKEKDNGKEKAHPSKTIRTIPKTKKLVVKKPEATKIFWINTKTFNKSDEEIEQTKFEGWNLHDLPFIGRDSFQNLEKLVRRINLRIREGNLEIGKKPGRFNHESETNGVWAEAGDDAVYMIKIVCDEKFYSTNCIQDGYGPLHLKKGATISLDQVEFMTLGHRNIQHTMTFSLAKPDCTKIAPHEFVIYLEGVDCLHEHYVDVATIGNYMQRLTLLKGQFAVMVKDNPEPYIFKDEDFCRHPGYYYRGLFRDPNAGIDLYGDGNIEKFRAHLKDFLITRIHRLHDYGVNIWQFNYEKRGEMGISDHWDVLGMVYHAGLIDYKGRSGIDFPQVVSFVDLQSRLQNAEILDMQFKKSCYQILNERLPLEAKTAIADFLAKQLSGTVYAMEDFPAGKLPTFIYDFVSYVQKELTEKKSSYTLHDLPAIQQAIDLLKKCLASIENPAFKKQLNAVCTNIIGEILLKSTDIFPVPATVIATIFNLHKSKYTYNEREKLRNTYLSYLSACDPTYAAIFVDYLFSLDGNVKTRQLINHDEIKKREKQNLAQLNIFELYEHLEEAQSQTLPQMLKVLYQEGASLAEIVEQLSSVAEQRKAIIAGKPICKYASPLNQLCESLSASPQPLNDQIAIADANAFVMDLCVLIFNRNITPNYESSCRDALSVIAKANLVCDPSLTTAIQNAVQSNNADGLYDLVDCLVDLYPEDKTPPCLSITSMYLTRMMVLRADALVCQQEGDLLGLIRLYQENFSDNPKSFPADMALMLVNMLASYKSSLASLLVKSEKRNTLFLSKNKVKEYCKVSTMTSPLEQLFNKEKCQLMFSLLEHLPENERSSIKTLCYGYADREFMEIDSNDFTESKGVQHDFTKQTAISFTDMEVFLNTRKLETALATNNLDTAKHLLQNHDYLTPKVDNNFAFRLAATRGHLPVLKYLLEEIGEEHRANPVVINFFPLRTAVYFGHLEVVNYLLRSDKVDISKMQTSSDKPSLARIALNGKQHTIFNRLIEFGGFTFDEDDVIAGAEENDLDFLKYLTAYGLKLNAGNDATLVKAAELGHIEIVDYLLGYRTPDCVLMTITDEPQKAKFDANSALLRTAHKLYYVNLVYGICREVLSDPAKLAVFDAEMQPNRLPNLLLADQIDHAIQLIGDDLLIVNPAAQNNQALCLAAENGHTSVVERLLLTNKVDPAADHNGPLHNNKPILSAMKNGHFDIVKCLINLPGVDPTRDSYATLFSCCVFGNVKMLELVMTHPKVDPTAPLSYFGKRHSMITLANEHQQFAVIALLLSDPRAAALTLPKHILNDMPLNIVKNNFYAPFQNFCLFQSRLILGGKKTGMIFAPPKNAQENTQPVQELFHGFPKEVVQLIGFKLFQTMNLTQSHYQQALTFGTPPFEQSKSQSELTVFLKFKTRKQARQFVMQHPGIPEVFDKGLQDYFHVIDPHRCKGSFVVRLPVIDDNRKLFFKAFRDKYPELELQFLDDLEVESPYKGNAVITSVSRCIDKLERYLFTRDPDRKAGKNEAAEKMIDFLEGKHVDFTYDDYKLLTSGTLGGFVATCDEAVAAIHHLATTCVIS